MNASRRESVVEPALPSLQIGWDRLRQHLRNPRFWAVQGLVVLATAVHVATDVIEHGGQEDETYLAVVLMYGLYLVPIIYASLNFGREGAIPTAIWAGLLALPTLVYWHEGIESVAELLQHVIIIALAVVIAGRVDREITARREAERAATAQRLSEAKHRALFEAAGEAILVFDRDGQIREANAAEGARFSSPPPRGRGLAAVLGVEAATHLQALARGAACGGHDLRWPQADGSELWLEPVCSRVPSTGDDGMIQALFRDVTDRRQQQHGLEAYTRQIIEAQEEERRRIAHELHDGPLQGLILLCRRLDELAVDRLEPVTAGAADVRLDDARQTAEQIADEVRRLSRDLRPSILDDLGLAPAVRWLAKEMEQRTGIRTRVIGAADERRIAPEAELVLFRIAQEALRNAERHARATEVTVALTIDDREARLVVEDDGHGMAKADVTPRAALAGKLGLLGMQERARLCGGSLTITTGLGRGTRIQAAIPSTS